MRPTIVYVIHTSQAGAIMIGFLKESSLPLLPRMEVCSDRPSKKGFDSKT
jgi:hypothetical protein